MKRIFLYLLMLTVVFSSCRKEDKAFGDKTPDDRINEALATYQTALLNSPYGWKAIYHTGTGLDYNFLFRFDDKNRVVMYGDIDTTSANAHESSYRLKALQTPALLFDTYSSLHRLADPNPNVNGGEAGVGLAADFEYAFDNMSGDTIVLKGRQNGTTMNLVKATQDDLSAWTSGAIKNTIATLSGANVLRTYFKRTTIGDAQTDYSFDLYGRQISFYTYNPDGSRVGRSSSFVVTSNSLSLTQPLTVGHVAVTSITDVVPNQGSHTINYKLNGSIASTIKEAASPVIIDYGAPKRWADVSYSTGYCYSIYGFTIDNVIDSFGVTTLPNYYYMIYYPKFNTTNIPNFDLMGLIIQDTAGIGIAYGSATSAPPTIANGKITFPILGTLTASLDDYISVGDKVAAQFSSTSGYYLVQVADRQYDMVSAKDARAWLRWYIFAN